MVRFYHVFLSSASAATEFITIVMKFPRDKQQRKKGGKSGTKRRDDEEAATGRLAVSAFISIHILFVVFIWAILERLSRPPGIINIMSGAHWSEFSRWTTPLCTRPRRRRGELSLGAAWTSCVRNKCFSFQMQLLLGYPRGSCFLSFSVAVVAATTTTTTNTTAITLY